MLVVRKEGKAHDRYNSFRSAFELLEAVGCEPQDCFEEKNEDLPPLQMLEQRMQQQIDDLRSDMQQQIDDLRSENKILRSRLAGTDLKPISSHKYS